MAQRYSEREQFQRTPGYNELFNAVTTSLKNKGVLAQMKANMLYSVFECAKDESGVPLTERMAKPRVHSYSNTGKFEMSTWYLTGSIVAHTLLKQPATVLQISVERCSR
jgi:hypothetical protein